jgi:hypothetical protein
MDRGQEDAVKARFRAETMADIRRSAGGGVVADANDVNFLRELSRSAEGGTEWSTGPTSYPVRPPSNLQVGLLPAMEVAAAYTASPLEGTARTLTDIEYLRTQAIAGFSKNIEDPNAGFLQSLSNRSWRAITNAGYDLVSSGVAISGLITDQAFRGQTVAGVKYLAEQVANDPVGAGRAVAAKAGQYWTENSLGQITEDVGRVGIGSLAASGTTVLGAKAIGVVGEGAMVAGRQLAPVAAELAETVLQKQGLALRVMPSDSKFLVGGDIFPNRVLPQQEVGSPYYVRIDPLSGSGPMAIDTAGYAVGETTLNGGVRNARQFWKDWSGTYPESLSDANATRVASKQSPIVDGTWIKNFPEHAGYEGETLIHHHLDYGPKAIPLPGTVHGKQPGWGIWHPEHSGN